MSASLLATACGGNTDLGSSGDGGSDGKRAALVIAQGGLGDESYNDLANAGFKRALKEYGVEGSPIESSDIVGQGEQILRRAGDSGVGLVIDLEFSHGKILQQVAKDYPKVNWAIVNTEAKGDNVASVLFEEQEGSYLAGALAAMTTKNTDNPKINDEKVIGVIGGTKSVGIDKFIAGYIQGARDVDPDVEVLTSYANTFGDPAKGKELAKSMYKQGADVIYAVAGGTGAGVIQAAEQQERYAIGVDTDQDGLAKGYVLTSMVKHTDRAVEQLVKEYDSGEFPGGTTLNFGLKNGGVGLSEMRYTKDDIPKAHLDRIDRIEQKIADGDTKVWNVVEQGYPSWFKG